MNSPPVFLNRELTIWGFLTIKGVRTYFDPLLRCACGVQQIVVKSNGRRTCKHDQNILKIREAQLSKILLIFFRCIRLGNTANYGGGRLP